MLTLAIRTCQLALQELGQSDVPVVKDWRLNERHYGGLTGLNKAETAAKHGEEQVKIWRRSYDVPPPPLAPDSPYDFASDPRYAGAVLPNTESLKTTLERVLPFWTASIVPVLRRGETVLVAAHGNSIRAIIKSLFDLSDEAILDVEVPTGNPLVIQLSADLKPLQAEYLDTERANPLPEVA